LAFCEPDSETLWQTIWKGIFLNRISFYRIWICTSVNQIPKPCGKQTVPLMKGRGNHGTECEEREEGNDSAKMLEPVFLDLLRSLGVDSQHGGPVRQQYLSYTGPPGYIGWRNLSIGIDSWAPETFTNTGSGAHVVRGNAACHVLSL
jgi:hypothetical protein